MNCNSRRKVQSLSPPRNRLSTELLKALHLSLVPPHCYVPFSDIVNRDSSLYGHESTKERRATTNKRHQLTLLRKSRFDQFKESCQELGVDCPPFFDPEYNIFYSTEEEFVNSKKIVSEEEAKRLGEEATRAAVAAKRALDKAKRMSSHFMLTNGTTGEETARERVVLNQLNLLYPEQNNGIFPIMANEVVVGTEKMSCLNIIVPLLDPRDLKKTHYSARLLQDYSGIIITQPTVPFFIYNSMKEMYDINKRDTCAQTKLQHDVVGTAICEDTSRQTKTTVWKFPPGMTCTNEYFNEDVRTKTATMYDLKTYSKFVYQTHVVDIKLSKTLKWYAPYLVWKLYVVNTVAKTGIKPVEEDDLLQNAFQGLSFINDY